MYPASVTPFNEKGDIDLPAVVRLLAWFGSNGCRGVVLAGTNGEGPSLSAPEKRELVNTAVPIAQRLGLEVILGVATPSLDEAIWLCKQAHQSGAVAALVMPPGYFREASSEGMEQWFGALLDKSPIDILAYNFPKRTGITLTPEMLAALASHPRLIGAKDSSGEEANLASYREALPEKHLYVGDETLLLEALDAGWTGTISGAANVMPMWLSQVVKELPENDEAARAKFELILPYIKRLRSHPQPATSKALLHRAGVLPSHDVRLPLTPAADVDELFEAMRPMLGMPS